jgi:ribosomal-protein-alanine N-acetyltransferase
MSEAGLEALFNQFPELRAGDLVLREVTQVDIPSLFSIFSDPQVMEFYDMLAFERTEQAAEMVDRWRGRFERRQAVRWGIVRAGQEQVIGTIGLYPETEWKAALGYDLGRAHWRQGIMTRALEAVIRFAFQQVELERLEALVLPGNWASAGLLGKHGFTREGLLRRYAYFKGAHHDLECYSLLRSEILPYD